MEVFEVPDLNPSSTLRWHHFLRLRAPFLHENYAYLENSKSYRLRAASIVFLVKFYIRIGPFLENFGNIEIGQNTFTK